jgi:type I restriction enzyme S subunit
MIKYDKYKSSEINWLGDIPIDWEVKRVKDLADYQSGNYIDAMEFDSEAPYPVYGGNGIRGNCNKYNHFGDYVLIGRQGALCGNINYAKDYFWATEHAVVVYKKKNINTIWLGELLRVMNLNQYALSAAQPGLSVEKIKRLELPFVPFKTQNLIADFINTKTQAIDKKVNLLIQKANYYKEYRKSLINEVVCKGLDKNVKLKDSGIDWIGLIPEHWDILRLKSLGNIETSSVNKKIEENEDLVKLVNYTDVYGNSNKEIWNDENYMVVSANIKQSQSKFLKNGDVLFTPSSETIEDIGVSAVVMENLVNTLYSYHLLRLRFSKNVFLNFKKYLFNNEFVQNYFSKSATGTTRKILGLTAFNNLLVIMPPTIKEQKEIANYLDQKTQTIDKIVSNINSQIQTLKELRKTLINDAVTGKIKITND